MFLRCSLFAALFAVHAVAHAASHVQAVPVPQQMLSNDFLVKVDGHSVDVAHAAASYSIVSFDVSGPTYALVSPLIAPTTPFKVLVPLKLPEKL